MKYFLSPETYFYTCASDFSKCEHPCVSEFMKYVVYILTLMLLFIYTNPKFSRLACNCY